MSNKCMAENYGVPRNTVSVSVKNKELALLEKKSTNSKRQKQRFGDFQKVDKEEKHLVY